MSRSFFFIHEIQSETPSPNINDPNINNINNNRIITTTTIKKEKKIYMCIVSTEEKNVFFLNCSV